MPKWLSAIADKIGIDDLFDKVEDILEDASEFAAVDFDEIAELLQKTGTECRELATETTTMCDETLEKSKSMITFGDEIHQTLAGFGKSKEDGADKDEGEEGSIIANDISILDTIRDLTDGQKVAEAMELAKMVERNAVNCVDRSMRMATILDDTMKALPEPVQRAIVRHCMDDDGDDVDDDDDEEADRLEQLMDLEGPMNEIKECIDELQDFNLISAIEVGSKAFEQLSNKAQLMQLMFLSVRKFSDNVQSCIEGIVEFDIRNIFSNGKRLLKSIRYSGLMKQLAEKAYDLVKMIVNIFHNITDRVSTLWEALAYCKEVMTSCLETVCTSQSLCAETKERSFSLVNKSVVIKDKLNKIGKVSKKSFDSLVELRDSGEIEEAVDISRSMMGRVNGCSENALSMIERVTDAFDKLPKIITDDIITESGEGEEDEGETKTTRTLLLKLQVEDNDKVITNSRRIEGGTQQDDDDDDNDIERSIQKLENSKKEIEDADTDEIANVGFRGFSDVLLQIDTCKTILSSLNDYIENCRLLIDDFMDVWNFTNLHEISNKVKRMCELVNLGDHMTKWAKQIQKLLDACSGLMNTTAGKLLNMDYEDLADDVCDDIGDTFGDAIDYVPGVSTELADTIGDVVGDGLFDAIAKIFFNDRVSDGAAVGTDSSDNLSAPQCLYKFVFETNTAKLSDVTSLRTLVLVLLLALILHVIKNKISVER